MFDLEQIILERHSTRLFLPKPVPRALVEEALALAVHAPSNSNIQPWRVVFASGPARDRLVAALLEEAHRGPPNIPPLPESIRQFRKELGAEVYGAMGIAREDKAGHDAAVLRNWEFFRAPLAGTSVTALHEYGHAASGYSADMRVLDQYFDRGSRLTFRRSCDWR